MENNNIFLFILILILFLYYCKKKIKKRKLITKKYGVTKIKNKDNVIEYYSNPPGHNCSQITSEFINQMIPIQEEIRQLESGGSNTNSKKKQIRDLYEEMRNQCRDQSQCRIKYFGPDRPDDSTTGGNIEQTICKPGNDENINNCRPLNRNGRTEISNSNLNVNSFTTRDTGSHFIAYDKVVTDTWNNLIASNVFMLTSDHISYDDFEYEINEPLYYIFRYDKGNFNELLSREEGDFTHSLFNNSPNFYKLYPVINRGQLSDFNDNNLSGLNDNIFNRCKDILKIIFMKEEMGEIYTANEIARIRQNYNDDNDDTVPTYVVEKYNEIILRVNNFTNEETIFILKNKPANILVRSNKNIFDYCDFINREPSNIDDNSNEITPDLIQKRINSKTYEIYYNSNGDLINNGVDVMRNQCESDANGEFIELFVDQNDLDKKDYFCLSKEEFENPKNKYYYSYYRENGNLITPNDDEFEEGSTSFEELISRPEIARTRRKTGIKSGNRIFSLAFDHLAKQCDMKFNNNGVLGSIFDPKSKDYKITSCVNSNNSTDENNYIADPESATREFYSIDNNNNFILYQKAELEIEDEEDTISDEDYFNLLPKS
jgi:hypothetical protein